jgi:hypothetical protein
MNKTCPQCGKSFRSDGNTRHSCSTAGPSQIPRSAEIPCRKCGKPFIRSFGQQRYCSDACRRKPPLVPIACRGCGKTFMPPNSLWRFCTPDCARNYGRKRPPLSVIDCRGCSKPFLPRVGQQRFCSAACAKGYWSPPLAEIPCRGCGTLFLPSTGQQRFCCEACRRSHAARKAAEPRRKGAVKCLVCGQTITRRRSSSHKLCSAKCRGRRAIQYKEARLRRLRARQRANAQTGNEGKA